MKARMACLALTCAFGPTAPHLAAQTAIDRPAAAPASGAAEATTALRYFERSAQDSDSAAARKDVQRAINCLVGPADRRFVAASGNPCRTAGRGAIPDSADDSVRQTLRYAIGEAENALKEADITSLQADVLAAMDYLHSADVDGPAAKPRPNPPAPGR